MFCYEFIVGINVPMLPIKYFFDTKEEFSDEEILKIEKRLCKEICNIYYGSEEEGSDDYERLLENCWCLCRQV